MKKKLLVVALIATIFTGSIVAQKTDLPVSKRWEKVEELAGKQLPESALKEVEAILAQAQQEKNSVEVIKALVYKMRFTLEKNPDEAPALIRNFEAFTEKCTDPAERALLHSMTAELYAQYYRKDSYTINSRTELKGLVPDDMKEWTKNIYFDKISTQLAASMENPSVLQHTDALKFAALLEKGEDSRSLQPTLFDFLGNRKMDILQQITQTTTVKNPLKQVELFADIPQFSTISIDSVFKSSIENQVLETYRQLLAFHLQTNNASALLYTDMQRLKYVKEHTEIENADSLYLVSLDHLEKQFVTNEALVEVLADKANYYLDKKSENPSYKKISYDICADGIRRFPKYKRIELLKNIQRNIRQENISISYNQLVKPFSALNININSENFSVLNLKIYRVNATAIEYYKFKQHKQNKNDMYPSRSLVETHQILVKRDSNFNSVATKFKLQTKDYGIYEFSIEEKENTKIDESVKGVFTVTDFSYINRSNNPDSGNLYVLDRMSGHPQGAVKVKICESKWMGSDYSLDLTNELTTNSNGLCVYPSSSSYLNKTFFLEKEKDCYFTSDFYTNYSSNNKIENKDLIVSVFTDRSLYRPGQIVYFKGIGYYSNKNKQEVLKGETFKPDRKIADINMPEIYKNATFQVELYDANNQKVATESVTANDFGSFTGKFVLPENGLNGAYRLQVGETSQFIWVEEYKRPTFEVKIEKPKNEVSFGEKVIMTGNVKAFAGYSVANAGIKYRVVRRTHRYCWWFNEPEKEICNGTTTSKSDGTFEVIFSPQKTKNELALYRGQFYTYTIYTDVTDSKGETQKGEQTLSVGDKSLFVLAEVPEKINKEQKQSLKISTVTINDEIINSTIKYTVSKLMDTDVYEENLNDSIKLKEVEQVLSGSFDTKNQKLDLDFNNLKSGRYKITLSTKDTNGRKVETEKIFIVYGTNEKRPSVKTYMWMLSPKTECEVGETAHFTFGTSSRNSIVLYEVMQGDKVLESRWIPFSDENKDFEISYKESYGAGVTVMFTCMKDEKLFTQSVEIKHKIVTKKLTPTLSVFRNKLLPGEKAEWTITIPESAKNKKTTELLVEMYDASLDAIHSHSWNFNPIYNEPFLHSPHWMSNSNIIAFDNADISAINKSVYQFQLNQLSWFGLSLGNGRYVGGHRFIRTSRKGGLLGKIFSIAGVKGNDSGTIDIADVKMSATSEVEEKVYDIIEPEIKRGKIENKPVQLRTNFNETAFFYPQLRTDAQGNVKFTFTAPESLTRWNVKMLAHTQDLYFGQGEAQVVTQKDLMVQMNLPRFVRRSDKLVLSANVVNLTGKEFTAKVQFELIDPATEKSIPLKDVAPKTVTLAANETKAVEWEVSEFSPYELVTCKVVARAGDFSDGEQNYLPVLPDKILVTESMPLTIRGNQTRTFNFDSFLKNSAKVDTKSLTVEFASNPAWYAVQALPSLAVPEHDNAIDYFAAYYVNSLATYIANSTPKIAATFDRWKKAGGSREALLSNLEKNKELKNMLLEETPWVMAAKDETEQKKQIALLFDLNMQKNQAQQYLDKLISLQLPSGGFSWFKGMPESRYVTQTILLNLGRLNSMVEGNVLATSLVPLKAALNYLDMEIARDFENLKQYNKNYAKEMSIDNMQLFYLHVRSQYPDIPVDAKAVEAVKFYTAQSEKYWTDLTLYGKGMMAVVAHRNGKELVADEILKSLKENALKTDEFGMYWAKNTAGYYWNEQPIAVHAAIIEAFAEVTKNNADVEEMKLWLLKQKQTQRWNSPMTSLDAIYALLHNGSDWLANDRTVKITLGNTLLQPQSVEAGTGYFKETIPVTNVRPEMGKVTVSTSSSEGFTPNYSKGFTPSEAFTKIGWGAIYWQYYQDMDNVSGQSGPLKVTKKLFVEKMTAAGKTMIPIEQTELKKGDKVITRLVITTDRNLEFVALKDLRAACFESVNQLSGCEWKEGVCYYQTTKDASTQFFFSYLPKGTYVFEYELWANSAGDYTSGIASLQCQYAPDFVNHTGGERVKIGL